MLSTIPSVLLIFIRLEITDDYIAWSTQIIPHSHYIQLHHIMWPRAVFGATYNSIHMFGHLQLIKIKVALGIKLSAMDRSAQRLSQTQALMARMQASGATGPGGQPNSPSFPGFGGQAPPRPNMPGMPYGINPAPSKSRKEQSKEPEEASAKGHSLKLPVSSDFMLALMMFMSTLGRTWSQTRMDTVPRGCFFVFGQIEVMGTKGRCKVDVHAAYDPKTAKYAFIIAKVKHFWDLEQAPKGGRR